MLETDNQIAQTFNLEEMKIASEGMFHLNKNRQSRLDAFCFYVSFLPWFNADMLHKFYLNVFESESDKENDDDNADKRILRYQERAITVADLIQSPIVRRIDYNSFIIDQQYKNKFKKFLPTLKDSPGNSSLVFSVVKVAYFMNAYKEAYHSEFPSPSYAKALDIAAALLLNPDYAVKKILEEINKSETEEDLVSTVNFYLKAVKDFDMDHPEKVGGTLKSVLNWIKNKTPDDDFVKKHSPKFSSRSGNTFSLNLPIDIIEKYISKEKELTKRRQKKNELMNVAKLHCLLVANNKYNSPHIHPLISAISDAELLESYLHANMHVSSLRLLRNASKWGIVNALKKNLRKLNHGDTLLFYFVGYGGMEYGHIEDVDKFICCSDAIKTDNHQETNRLSHFEIQSLYKYYYDKKDIQIISILDCGYKTESKSVKQNILQREIFEGKRYRSLPKILNRRHPSELIYKTESFRPGDVWEHNLISVHVSAEDQEVMESDSGGLFVRSLIEITTDSHFDKNNYEASWQKLSINQLEENYNRANLKDLFDQTLKIWRYPKLNRDELLFQSFLKSGEELIESRIMYSQGELNLSGLGLEKLPTNLFDKNTFTRINLNSNSISNISEEFVRTRLLNSKHWSSIFKNLPEVKTLKIVQQNKLPLKDLAALHLIAHEVIFETANYSEKEIRFLKDIQLFKNIEPSEVILDTKVLKKFPDFLNNLDRSPTLKNILDKTETLFNLYKTLDHQQLLSLLQDIIPFNQYNAAVESRMLELNNRTRQIKPILWALVTGTSNRSEFNNNPILLNACKDLAKELVKNKIGLATSTWSGVDTEITRYYLKELEKYGYNPKDFIKVYITNLKSSIRVFSPTAQKMFNESIIDKDQILGTGSGSRITKRDVNEEIERRKFINPYSLEIVKFNASSYKEATNSILGLGDMLFIIGGAQGAQLLGMEADDSDIFVFPLPGTGGAADDFEFRAVNRMNYSFVHREYSSFNEAISDSIQNILEIDEKSIILYLGKSSNAFNQLKEFAKSRNKFTIYHEENTVKQLLSCLEFQGIHNIDQLDEELSSSVESIENYINKISEHFNETKLEVSLSILCIMFLSPKVSHENLLELRSEYNWTPTFWRYIMLGQQNLKT